MHKWNSIELQNCKWKSKDLEFAVFEDDYIVKEGFWDKYRENSFGVNNLGKPKSNEKVIGENTCQDFENGVLIWNKNIEVKSLVGNNINCNNYTTEYKFPNCFSDVNESVNYSRRYVK